MYRLKYLILILILLLPSLVFSQAGAGVKITERQGDLYDNVKKVENPYIFPLWGEKVARKGFLLPYPIGIMVNGYMGEQDVTISDLSVGINDGKMISLDDVIGFSDVTASIQNINMRADLWVFPFLDVYGIFGKAWVQTEVGVNKPIDFTTQADFDGYVYGGGMMLSGGFQSFFFSLDFNTVWTHFDAMKKDNVAMNLAPRIGYVFHPNSNPESNLAVWTGAGRIFLNNTTEGSISMSEILPDVPGEKVQAWYDGLPPLQQEVVKDIYESIINKHGDDVIHYSLEKRPVKNWTMIVGAQYQINRHWQLRTEANFLGGRRSGLLSLNYRFGIK